MKRNIQRLLVANRGEIAVRIFRSARALGIETVAVYSDADKDALHVQEADMAVHIGASPSSESYLVIDALLDACRRTGADAVHPGYGFLSENAAFARACEDAGVIFVGPRAEAIESMGSKSASKALAVEAGVPVVPGYYGSEQSDEHLLREAEAIGYPVLFKASAGGGGRGMRLVYDPKDAPSALQDARSESLRAFGDDLLLVEKYIERPRHIEVQVLADAHGHVVHLGERECSIQRRHQKVLEESPSPFVDDALRARMGADAVKLAKAIGYQNAGTVEFIVDPDGNYYFLEMNTRLQVEHPVTEMVTGIDLVHAQLAIAEGQPLAWTQEEIQLTGASIEARIYAEEPHNQFLPASGTLWRWREAAIDGVRTDSGVQEGDVVSVHYDPMLAKVIVHAPTRSQATKVLTRALQQMEVAGVATNRAFLVDILLTEGWIDGATHTHFIDETYVDGWTPTAESTRHWEAALAASIAVYDQRMRERSHLPHLPGAYRNSRVAPSIARYESDGEALELHYVPSGYRYEEGQGSWQAGAEADALAAWRYRVDADRVTLTSPEGMTRHWRVSRGPEGRFYAASIDGSVELKALPRFIEPGEEDVAGGAVAPMNGTVLRVLVAEGDAVEAGQTLIVLEAMKMEHRVAAAEDGVVTTLSVQEGDLVDAGQVLAIVEGSED